MVSIIREKKAARRSIAALVLCGVVAFALWTFGFYRKGSSETFPARPLQTNTSNLVAACPGRVEGAGEVINVGAGMDGVLAQILVHEGQQVKAGQVLAIIDRKDLSAELSTANATAESARMVRSRLVRGSRDEQRDQAAAEAEAAESVLKQADSRYQRYQQLFEQGVIPADTRDEARRDLEVAQSNLRAASKHEELVNAAPLPEELRKADADVRAASEHVRVVSEQLRRCEVTAPISGTILKTYMKAGETFSTFNLQPILGLADTSRLRVRAEVDERDVGRVFVGQKVKIRGDALQDREITGTVEQLGAQMGRKRVRTGDPAEKADRDVLEVLIDLNEKDTALIVGLRVTAQFLAPSTTNTP